MDIDFLLPCKNLLLFYDFFLFIYLFDLINCKIDVSGLAIILSLVMFTSPINDIKKIQSQQTVGNRAFLPYLSLYNNTIIWYFYFV